MGGRGSSSGKAGGGAGNTEQKARLTRARQKLRSRAEQ